MKYIFLILFFLSSCWVQKPEIVIDKPFNEIKKENSLEKDWDSKKQQRFLSSWLQTNTSISSINIDLVISGWPSKDGIPAINQPTFSPIQKSKEKMSYLRSKDFGISVAIWGEAKFYPYAVMVWHEIVNDIIDDTKIAVTFCPLCGSAIVYDRETLEWLYTFWVSGKLFQSNMLMYDSKTESLWSQSLWEAVVWEKLWVKLDHIWSNLMTFSEFEAAYPNWKVLSDNTGYTRNYGLIPYGDYDTSDDLYFSVENSDTRFPKKEIFYVVPFQNSSIVFHFLNLKEEWQASFNIWDKEITITFNDWIIEAKNDQTILAGYYEMWFSWRTHNPKNENIWSKK